MRANVDVCNERCRGSIFFFTMAMLASAAAVCVCDYCASCAWAAVGACQRVDTLHFSDANRFFQNRAQYSMFIRHQWHIEQSPG